MDDSQAGGQEWMACSVELASGALRQQPRTHYWRVCAPQNIARPAPDLRYSKRTIVARPDRAMSTWRAEQCLQACGRYRDGPTGEESAGDAKITSIPASSGEGRARMTAHEDGRRATSGSHMIRQPRRNPHTGRSRRRRRTCRTVRVRKSASASGCRRGGTEINRAPGG